jgi:putative hemolysin
MDSNLAKPGNIETGPQQVDIDKIFREKNPTLYRFLPKFILNYVKRIIHQEEINHYIKKHQHKYGIDFSNAIIDDFNVRINVKGIENVPKTGGYIFASNHPLGGFDALIIISALAKIRTDIKFIVNDILMSLQNLKTLFVPVNKHGRNKLDLADRMEDAYKSDEAVFIFPAGLVSRRQGKEIKDLVWKKSFITKSKKHHKDVVPVFIEGQNSSFFYNLSYWRTKIGIKANIEMFYLADELFKHKNKTFTVTFGKPISWQTFDKTRSDLEWAESVKEHVYKLRNDETIIF